MIVVRKGSNLYKSYTALNPLKFTCGVCDCCFVLTEKEYLESQFECNNGDLRYTSACPYCGNAVHAYLDTCEVSFHEYLSLFSRDNQDENVVEENRK